LPPQNFQASNNKHAKIEQFETFLQLYRKDVAFKEKFLKKLINMSQKSFSLSNHYVLLFLNWMEYGTKTACLQTASSREEHGTEFRPLCTKCLLKSQQGLLMVDIRKRLAKF
jgi:hypothetical protein